MEQQKIVLLTGWGTSCHAWDRIIPVLQQRYQVRCISPPWASRGIEHHTLKNFDEYINKLAQDLREADTIVAWSFGGLLAIQLATKFPNLVARIIFISSSANFITNEVSLGIDPAWFAKFKHDFSLRPTKLLHKFFMLTNHGDEFAKEATESLKQSCLPEHYDLDECIYALELLGTLDLSIQLSQLSCPTCFIHGENDAVLNMQAAEYAAKQTSSKLYIIQAAGHAPHISHPLQVTELITQVVPA